jgi:NitT/TauT family transport system ATP-binding protein
MQKPYKPYIQVKNLSFNYVNSKNIETQALKDISFDVNRGEFVAIIGPSGCGKTTLLNCIDGLLSPSFGEIKINKKKVTIPGKDRAYVFQDPLLLPWRNVLGNIAFGAQMHGVNREVIKERSENLVKIMHLNGFEKFYPHQLSGGMKQRVNIARALCIYPEILLLDEPFSNLDAQIKEIMQEEILNIYDKFDKTFIFVTHNIEEAIYLADKVIILSKRPAVIKKIIKVNFKRPRNILIKDTKEFMNIKRHIAKIIQNEINF